MAGLMKREPRAMEPRYVFDRLDQMFDEWTHLLPFGMFEPVRMPTLREREWQVGEFIRVDEYRDGDDLVVRAEVPGVDPEKDVNISVSDDRLHIEAERREEREAEKTGFVRRETRYGRFTRDLPLPTGVTESDVSARYTDGILEIRVHAPAEEEPTRIPVARS